MAGPDELDSFVRKFRTLWQSRRNAKSFVETEAGHAFVNLQVGLGQAQPEQPVWHGGRGGSPSKQRRLERRAEERQEVAAAAAELEKVEKGRKLRKLLKLRQKMSVKVRIRLQTLLFHRWTELLIMKHTL
jgi:hypothetical protein